MPHVTGIGGVFIKAKGDHKALAAWYQENLGIEVQAHGTAVFRWGAGTAQESGATAWRVFESNSDMFGTSGSGFTINYCVDDMAGLITKLRKAGVKIVKEPESHDYGTFASIMDPEGNRIELWEPKNG